ncbi:hypothetical protein AO353_20955 [Pseudomonas fluorescens]|uniref:Lysis protein n=1 Tax=Pseudomonas fluorescens TaxID=294 RepID=A0A0N9W8Q1_PSEFL|nr:hypothetical protein AO353_20955 [Pseudomonas fluorescens]
MAGGAAALAWQLQDWRYGRQLAEQSKLHGEALNELTRAAATQQRTEQDKRLAASDQTHYEALTHAQKDQARLRDRLATSDLRLSVLIDVTNSASGCAVPATPSAGGVVSQGGVFGDLRNCTSLVVGNNRALVATVNQMVMSKHNVVTEADTEDLARAAAQLDMGTLESLSGYTPLGLPPLAPQGVPGLDDFSLDG